MFTDVPMPLSNNLQRLVTKAIAKGHWMAAFSHSECHDPVTGPNIINIVQCRFCHMNVSEDYNNTYYNTEPHAALFPCAGVSPFEDPKVVAQCML